MDAPSPQPPSQPPPPAANRQIFDNPVDDPDCYPNINAFMLALQDPGKLTTVAKKQQSSSSSNDSVIGYPLLMKVLGPVQKILQDKYSSLGVPKHPTEVRRQLALACVRTRKSRDKVTVPESFRKYGGNYPVVFVINHNEVNGGFNVPLQACIDFWQSQRKKDVDSRTANDGCRVAAIMLLQEFRDSVVKIMKEKRDRQMLDQATCPITAFYEVAAAKFRDPSFVAKLPALFTSIEGHQAIDPNDVDRIMRAGRNGAWFKSTWEVYLRPKYRKALGRWWSETGGGGGEMENFQNYCAREKWLAYVYMLDVEASHLLASNASSVVPKELLNECGAGVGGTSEGSGTSSAKKKSPTNNYDASSLLHVADTCASNINKVASLMSQLIEKRVEQCNNYSTPVSMSSTPPTKKRTFVECLDEVKRLREHEKQVAEDQGVSPATKELVLNRIQKEKKKVLFNAANIDDD
jgi:hypothetical protein